MSAPITSIAHPCDRAWLRYRQATIDADEHPTEEASIRRERARKEWLDLAFRQRTGVTG